MLLFKLFSGADIAKWLGSFLAGRPFTPKPVILYNKPAAAGAVTPSYGLPVITLNGIPVVTTNKISKHFPPNAND